MDLRTYALAIFWLAVAGAAVAMFEQPLGSLRTSAVILIVAAVAMSFGLWATARTSSKSA
jgi:hypothetical protein